MAALSISELEGARDNLVRQLAKGVLSVTDQNGERVQFSTLGEMQRAIANIESRIAAMQGAGVNQIQFQTSKGT